LFLMVHYKLVSQYTLKWVDICVILTTLRRAKLIIWCKRLICPKYVLPSELVELDGAGFASKGFTQYWSSHSTGISTSILFVKSLLGQTISICSFFTYSSSCIAGGLPNADEIWTSYVTRILQWINVVQFASAHLKLTKRLASAARRIASVLSRTLCGGLDQYLVPHAYHTRSSSKQHNVRRSLPGTQ
jgi:hypothetical protein